MYANHLDNSNQGCHAHGFAWACESPCGSAKSAGCRRRGFTLVELIMTMAIMAVLSAMIAVALAGAEESAKVSHTRALIARLHTLLMDRYESYRWRRLPIKSTAGDTPAQAAQARCNAVRDLMRMELPDRWTDIDNNDGPAVLLSPPSAYLAYNSAYNTAAAANGGKLDTTYQGADCLYWIVTMGLEENDVLENFSQSDIGTDPNNPNSGLRCFIDSWGNPIQFLRWAPGFNSPMQPQNPSAGVYPTDRDQTDPTGVYGSPYPTGSPTGTYNATTGQLSTPPPITFALYPLIYSAGPDGYYDIYTDNTATPIRYSQTSPPDNPFVNFPGTNSNPAIGTPQISVANTTGVLGSYDNITNQAIGAH